MSVDKIIAALERVANDAEIYGNDAHYAGADPTSDDIIAELCRRLVAELRREAS